MSHQSVSPFVGQDLRTLLDQRAERDGGKLFLIWEPFEGPGATWTYSQFVTAVRRFAAGLEARGLTPGDRVLVHLENCPESLIAWLGCGYAGVVAVTTNTRSTGEELGYFARHANVRAAVTQPSFAELVQASAPDLEWLAVTGRAEPQPRGSIRFDDVGSDSAALRNREHDPAAPFAIQFTSGTTSRPKAVLWSHGNFLWGARSSAVNEDLRGDDVHLVHLPLFHTNAQIYSVAASLWVGATVVLQPRFSASRFWEVSLRNRCTWTSMVPFCVKALMSAPKPQAHHYRLWGNAVCAPPTDGHFGVDTIGWWGMTETVTHGIVGSAHQVDGSMSMGRPAPGYRVYILDAEGQPVSPGEVGDLFIGGERGLSLFLEYAGDPVATASAFTEDGLFITGDRVRLGEDGCLYFADRSKDMLKVGGENVAASEIEQVIGKVAGVAEVAVVGRKHPMLDEVPVAFVVPSGVQSGELSQQILSACRLSLSDFKVPHEVRLIDALPRLTLEKVAKAQLRQWLEEDGASQGEAASNK